MNLIINTMNNFINLCKRISESWSCRTQSHYWHSTESGDGAMSPLHESSMLMILYYVLQGVVSYMSPVEAFPTGTKVSDRQKCA